MEDKIQHSAECSTPEMGRGCSFCNCTSECSATPHEGCYKLHSSDWLEQFPNNLPDDIVEVRFKNTRRSFYRNVNNLPLKRGDIVAVEASPGHDIGIVSLTGDMVARQMFRIGFTPMGGEFKKIYRKAKPYDIEKWQEAIALEHDTMIRSRRIAADMGLNMKIGDVEYQGDKIKAIFYYIADERVDFRELIKVFAEQFRIRVEMKQIGARQEAGRIGGLGACGRELCCASWIPSFSSVTTNAARVQEISLNPQKLAGQCSKLKCCLVYEYDSYSDARREFPRVKEPLQALDGEYFLVKSDILARTMSFSSAPNSLTNLITLPIERVREIIALNRRGHKVETLWSEDITPVEQEPDFVNVIGEDSITRFDKSKKRRNGRNKSRNDRTEKGAERNAEKSEKLDKSAIKAENIDKSTQPDTATPHEEKQEERREGRREGGRNNRRNDRRNDHRPRERFNNEQAQGGETSTEHTPTEPNEAHKQEEHADNQRNGERRNHRGGRNHRNHNHRPRREGGERNGERRNDNHEHKQE
ncbi:MAG: hypothetical protein II315_03755 [Rikenellaceae bacterium]|nr:hypothetical protein [Rikenellaceae bacterium]